MTVEVTTTTLTDYCGRARDILDCLLDRDPCLDCREPSGFGFVQYLGPDDYAETKYQMDRKILLGEELAFVFVEENRKQPSDMTARECFTATLLTQ
ncbi:hypothetical protein L1987_00412 [Smallanthus sonchifolius]|uniref:Uncharacterized protein n=1 Tax=Smallanthus sonchifolius TaxID=185202 RepID=A0ACB9K227_9ASTR|nr:hypothetical protein L1987_00412 [Smallanthus sonchifolius]